MATTRSYEDACGMAHALNLVGERWAMHVLRELMLGPKRYSDLQADLPGISTNMLRDRLRELEGAGLLRRRKLDPPAASWVYELTPYGADLEPVITVLGRWGARHPGHRPDLPISVASFVLSLRTNADPAKLAGVDVVTAVEIGGEAFTAVVRDGQFRIDRGTSPEATASIAGPPEALAGAVYGGVAPADLGLKTTGDIAPFLGVFSLPAKAF
ncbi:MAG: transcriptional regulator [Marmoricola sp.]|nr:transcriptional regulator [Marmoricola sp.]